MIESDIEVIAINPGDKKSVKAGKRHRICRDASGRASIEISNNGQPGFRSYSVEVTYYCFSLPNVYRTPIPIREMEID